MSENPEGAPAAAETEAPNAAAAAEAPAQGTDWKAEARKWEQRAKENSAKVDELSPLAARLAEIEESNKTAEQKTAERVAALEESDRSKDAALAERDAKLLRYEIAAAKGLDLKAALRLQGSTKEELEADADEFTKSFGAGIAEIPGAGARGETRVQTTPGLGTLMHAYESASK